MQEKHHKLPGVGARILKSSLGVALCMLTYFLRGENGMPFYSALAVLWCMQPYSGTTLSMAKQRSLGTLIGAGFGLAFLLAESLFDSPSVAVVYFCASAMIIPVIYLTVLINKRNASFFSCVVFLSITVTHSFDENPYLFVLNRVLDTFIGIAIGVLLNNTHLPFKHDNSVIYVSGIDFVLVGASNQMTAYNKVELNRMIDKGAKFTVSSIESPATIRSLMEGVNLKLPVIAMDGAVMYDLKENRYLERITLDRETEMQCEEIITECGLHCFVNSLCDNVLMIYYGDFVSENERDMFEKRRRSPYRNYIRKEYRTSHSEVVYLYILGEDAKIAKAHQRLMQKLSGQVRVTILPSNEYEGYSEMRIYSPDSGKKIMLEKLKECTNSESCVTFGSIEGQYDVIVHDDGGNSAVKEFRRRYKKSRAKKA